MDFNKYDDVLETKDYNGFIDKLGNFYKVSKRKSKIDDDTHNIWAEAFMKKYLSVEEFKLNPTVSMLLTLSKLNGPASVLINCFGFTYYSHDPFYFLPIIKAPDPKIANYKVTQEQIDTLFQIMYYNNENTDILMDFEEGNLIDYCGMDEKGKVRCKKLK